MYCFVPVIKGFWRQYELWDGTYNIIDLLDIHEAIDVINLNEALLQEHYRMELETTKRK